MIIGHYEQKKIVERILLNNDNGFYILKGPEAVGKFFLLKEIILEINKEKHLFDYFIFDNDDYILKINTANFLNKLLFLKGEKKIIVINDAHRLNKEAQNRLLKTLEEFDSKSLVFFITFRAFKILPTIRSRSFQINFNLVDNEEIKNFLLSKNFDQKLIDRLIDIFPGQIGFICKILENLNDFKKIYTIYNSNDVFEKIDNLNRLNNFNLSEILTYFIYFERKKLLNKDKNSIYKIKQLLSLYEDSQFFLNRDLQLINFFLNSYGKSI